MIKCNKKGEITFKGNVPDLMTDLSMIARATREFFMERGMSKDEAEEGIKHAVELGFLTEQELAKEINKLVKELMDLIPGESKNEQKYLRTRNSRRKICFSSRESSGTRSNAERR